MRTIDLLYVIDKNVKPPEGLNDSIAEKHKFKIRDIIINRVDKIYHSKMLHIKEPLNIINKLKEFKRCEVNVTSVIARKQLYSLQYEVNRETAMQFLDRFEEIVHPNSKKNTLASVSLASSSNHAKKINDRCFECDDRGHMKNECPLKGKGLRKCYECNQFTTHLAFQCPQRLNRQTNGPNRGGQNGRRTSNNNNNDSHLYAKNKRSFKPTNNRGNRNSKFRRVDSNHKNKNFQNSNRKFNKNSTQFPQNQSRHGTAEIPKVNLADN